MSSPQIIDESVVNKVVSSVDSTDSKDAAPKYSIARVKKAMGNLNSNIIENLPSQLKEKIPLNAPVLQVLAAFLCLYLTIGYGARFFCSVLGFLYPAYASVKAIESKEKADDTEWLTYWVVYSAFSMVEFFTDIILFWVPFYWFFKCCFLVYCMAPTSYNGSLTIYNRLIRPFVLENQEKINNVFENGAKLAEEIARDVANEGAKAYIDQKQD